MGEQINELVTAQQEIRRIEGGNVLAAVRALRMASVDCAMSLAVASRTPRGLSILSFSWRRSNR